MDFLRRTITSNTTVFFHVGDFHCLLVSGSLSAPSECVGGSHLVLVAMRLPLANWLQVDVECATPKPKCFIAVIALFTHWGNRQIIAADSVAIIKWIILETGRLSHCMEISVPGKSPEPTVDILWMRINLCSVIPLRILDFFGMALSSLSWLVYLHPGLLVMKNLLCK